MIIETEKSADTPEPKHFRTVRRAATLAAFNGWTFAILGAASLLYGVVTLFVGERSVASILVGVILVSVAFNEFRGRAMLRNYEPQAAPMLGWNQVAFMTAIVVYALWCICYYWMHQDVEVEKMRQIADFRELEDLDIMPLPIVLWIVVGAVYGLLIVLTLVFQGINAIYYFTRRKHLLACREQVIGTVYGLLIVLTLAFQGFNAIYYFTRQKHLLACREQDE